jgi:CheY-like chemotaxis protein
VKSLVELHGGRITAESKGEGKGSAFAVWLRRIEELEVQEAPKQIDTEPMQSALKVLVVDDNIDAAQTLAMLLREANGYNVTVCHDGRSALRHVENYEPGAVILDIGLPDIDGYEVARQFRQMKPSASTVLIALTGYGQPQDVELARQAGFDHHLSKPANFKAINDLLVLNC